MVKSEQLHGHTIFGRNQPAIKGRAGSIANRATSYSSQQMGEASLKGNRRSRSHQWDVGRVGREVQPITIYAKTETKLLPAKTQRLIEFLIARLNPAE